jgi:NAD(P)-dependent dehydrogenase (short-subunit alcohol dehydrogenase family)
MTMISTGQDERLLDRGLKAKAGTAIISGGSQGLGLALTEALAARGWTVVVDARHASTLAATTGTLVNVHGVPGDINDPAHRRELVDTAMRLTGRVDVIVNNASTLGPLPMRRLAEFDVAALMDVFATNVVAPLALVQAALPYLSPGACVINISSDAAVGAYERWGGYGTSKAALDHLSRVLAVEHPDVRIYSVDPGDMRTAMHQDAFPGEDISDRPLPAASVPGLLTLIEGSFASGRYSATQVTS